MAQNKNCNQNAILLNLDVPAFFNKILVYSNIYIVEARVLYADKPISYYLIDKYGEFINTDFIRPNLKNSPYYSALLRKYPKATVWDIISKFPPQIIKLHNGVTRIIFVRKITNLCRACPVIATSIEAYDFSKDGKFLGSLLLPHK